VTGQTGRPTIRSEETIEVIIDALMSGILLPWVCKGDGMPSLRTVYRWMEDDPDLLSRIARAREICEDVIIAETRHMANTPLEGVEDTLAFKEIDDPEGGGGKSNELVVVERKRKDMLGHRKLVVDTNIRLLEKMNPGRWGARVALDHGVQGNLADQLAAARKRAMDGLDADSAG
jgi:hypothetical protein